MKFQTGDAVIVKTGKDKGKTGTIAYLNKKNDTVTIEGVNLKTKHVKGRDGNPGDRVEIAAPLHVSNVAAVDPKTKKPTRIGYQIDKDGQKVRIYKASGEVIKGKTSLGSAPKAKKETPKKD